MADKLMRLHTTEGDVDMRISDNGDGSYSFGMNTRNSEVASAVLLNAVTTNVAGAAVAAKRGLKTFQAYGATSAGAGAVDVDVYGTNIASPNTATDGVLLGTISLVLSTTRSSAAFASDANYQSVWGVTRNISGTNAAASLVMGY